MIGDFQPDCPLPPYNIHPVSLASLLGPKAAICALPPSSLSTLLDPLVRAFEEPDIPSAIHNSCSPYAAHLCKHRCPVGTCSSSLL